MTTTIEIVSGYGHASVKIIPIGGSRGYRTIFFKIVSFSSYEDEILTIFYVVDESSSCYVI